MTIGIIILALILLYGVIQLLLAFMGDLLHYGQYRLAKQEALARGKRPLVVNPPHDGIPPLHRAA